MRYIPVQRKKTQFLSEFFLEIKRKSNEIKNQMESIPDGVKSDIFSFIASPVHPLNDVIIVKQLRVQY